MFTTQKKQTKGFKFTLIQFGDKIYEPKELQEINPPDVELQHGVVISGRGPIWLYGFLLHWYHPAAWVATHDPRINGAVVVATHVRGVSPGMIIPLE